MVLKNWIFGCSCSLVKCSEREFFVSINKIIIPTGVLSSYCKRKEWFSFILCILVFCKVPRFQKILWIFKLEQIQHFLTILTWWLIAFQILLIHVVSSYVWVVRWIIISLGAWNVGIKRMRNSWSTSINTTALWCACALDVLGHLASLRTDIVVKSFPQIRSSICKPNLQTILVFIRLR